MSNNEEIVLEMGVQRTPLDEILTKAGCKAGGASPWGHSFWGRAGKCIYDGIMLKRHGFEPSYSKALNLGILLHECMAIFYTWVVSQRSDLNPLAPCQAVQTWALSPEGKAQGDWAQKLYYWAQDVSEWVIAYQTAWKQRPGVGDPIFPTLSFLREWDYPPASIGPVEMQLGIMAPFPWTLRADLLSFLLLPSGQWSVLNSDFKTTSDAERLVRHFWQEPQSSGFFYVWSKLRGTQGFPDLPGEYFCANIIEKPDSTRKEPVKFRREFFPTNPYRIALWEESMKHLWGRFSHYLDLSLDVPDAELHHVVPMDGYVNGACFYGAHQDCPRVEHCLRLQGHIKFTSTPEIFMPKWILPGLSGVVAVAPAPAPMPQPHVETCAVTLSADGSLGSLDWQPQVEEPVPYSAPSTPEPELAHPSEACERVLAWLASSPFSMVRDWALSCGVIAGTESLLLESVILDLIEERVLDLDSRGVALPEPGLPSAQETALAPSQVEASIPLLVAAPVEAPVAAPAPLVVEPESPMMATEFTPQVESIPLPPTEATEPSPMTSVEALIALVESSSVYAHWRPTAAYVRAATLPMLEGFALDQLQLDVRGMSLPLAQEKVAAEVIKRIPPMEPAPAPQPAADSLPPGGVGGTWRVLEYLTSDPVAVSSLSVGQAIHTGGMFFWVKGATASGRILCIGKSGAEQALEPTQGVMPIRVERVVVAPKPEPAPASEPVTLEEKAISVVQGAVLGEIFLLGKLLPLFWLGSVMAGGKKIGQVLKGFTDKAEPIRITDALGVALVGKDPTNRQLQVHAVQDGIAIAKTREELGPEIWEAIRKLVVANVGK